MKNRSKIIFASIGAALSLTTSVVAEKASETSEPLFDGILYSRVSYAYQSADSYHSGENSFASSVFENNDGSYQFNNLSLDVVYISKTGFYVASGVYLSAAEVSTDGLGALNVPDTDSDYEFREVPLAVGYETDVNDTRLRFEGRYIFNVDDDFDVSLNKGFADAVLLPVTDGSDSFALSARAKREIFGLENTLVVAYQMYENDVSHPLFPSFSLGDRITIDYEIAKVFGDAKVSVGHLYSHSESTEGELSGITGTAYLTEKPRSSELRAGLTYRFTPRLLGDIEYKYTYSGSDAPKQDTFIVGLAYLF
jgi:hypothetical protein